MSQRLDRSQNQRLLGEKKNKIADRILARVIIKGTFVVSPHLLLPSLAYFWTEFPGELARAHRSISTLDEREFSLQPSRPHIRSYDIPPVCAYGKSDPTSGNAKNVQQPSRWDFARRNVSCMRIFRSASRDARMH